MTGGRRLVVNVSKPGWSGPSPDVGVLRCLHDKVAKAVVVVTM